MESTLRLFYLTFYLVEEGIFRGLDVRDTGSLLLFLRREEGLQRDPVLRHGLNRPVINKYVLNARLQSPLSKLAMLFGLV